MAHWVSESIVDGWEQRIRAERLVHEEKSPYQQLSVFETKNMGRVLVIDDRIQLTERDEFGYHEMFAHVPITAHGNVRSVLIVGGGDGGTLREVLKHPSVQATLVDIDERVIGVSKEYLPSLSAGAFDHPRSTVLIEDANKYVAETDKRYDVVLIDSTDPEEEGPSAVLYQEAFYRNCKRVLSPGGVVVTQHGHPMFEDYPMKSLAQLASVFAHTTVYHFCVPTYLGGVQTFGFASDNGELHKRPSAEVEARWAANPIEGTVRHYTPRFHAASFHLPKWLEDEVGKAVGG